MPENEAVALPPPGTGLGVVPVRIGAAPQLVLVELTAG